jgi:hypothetical protein
MPETLARRPRELPATSGLSFLIRQTSSNAVLANEWDVSPQEKLPSGRPTVHNRPSPLNAGPCTVR